MFEILLQVLLPFAILAIPAWFNRYKHGRVAQHLADLREAREWALDDLTDVTSQIRDSGVGTGHRYAQYALAPIKDEKEAWTAGKAFPKLRKKNRLLEKQDSDLKDVGDLVSTRLSLTQQISEIDRSIKMVRRDYIIRASRSRETKKFRVSVRIYVGACLVVYLIPLADSIGVVTSLWQDQPDQLLSPWMLVAFLGGLTVAAFSSLSGAAYSTHKRMQYRQPNHPVKMVGWEFGYTLGGLVLGLIGAVFAFGLGYLIVNN